MWPYFSSPCRFRGTGRSTSFRWRKRRRSPSPSSGAGAPVALPTPFLTHKVTQASSRLGRAFGGVLPPAAEQMQTSGRFPTEGRRTSKLRWSQPANYCWRPASTTLQPLEMELNFCLEKLRCLKCEKNVWSSWTCGEERRSSVSRQQRTWQRLTCRHRLHAPNQKTRRLSMTSHRDDVIYLRIFKEPFLFFF